VTAKPAELMNISTSRIQPSIITSFTVTGAAADLAKMPIECLYIEVYAFMQSSMPCSTPATADQGAVTHMAELYRQRRSEEVASWIIDAFPGKLVAAIATFIPELTANPLEKGAIEDGEQALKLLIEVVRVLRSKNHPVNTIELVGGSCIQRVYRVASARTPHQFLAHRLTRSQSMERLLDRLKSVAEYAFEPQPVFLSLELEPGPLFTLSDGNALLHFCANINNSSIPSLQRCVGLNLDIPHWQFLAGITPDWLVNPNHLSVLERIVHAHVCDHHIAHFCDTVPGTFNDLAAFSRWFDLLQQIHTVKNKPGLPEFSGFVSCEMEACKDERLLKSCFSRISAAINASAPAIQ